MQRRGEVPSFEIVSPGIAGRAGFAKQTFLTLFTDRGRSPQVKSAESKK